MLKIRLRRMGSTHRPFYRVVVSDSRRTPTTSALEEIGYYDPRRDPSVVKIDTERVEYWTGRGAQVSDAVKKLVKEQGKGAVSSFSAASADRAEADDSAEAASIAEAPVEEKAEAAEEKAEAASDTAPVEEKAEATEEKAEATEEKAEATEEKAEAAEEKAEAETTEAASA